MTNEKKKKHKDNASPAAHHSKKKKKHKSHHAKKHTSPAQTPPLMVSCDEQEFDDSPIFTAKNLSALPLHQDPNGHWDDIDLQEDFDPDRNNSPEASPRPTKTQNFLQFLENYIPGGRWLLYTFLMPIYQHNNLAAQDLSTLLAKFLDQKQGFSVNWAQRVPLLKAFGLKFNEAAHTPTEKKEHKISPKMK